MRALAVAATIILFSHVGAYADEAPPLKPVITGSGMTLDIEKRADRVIIRQMLEKQEAGTKKPNMFLHPIKRYDLWCDEHPDGARKFRTRYIPATQFLGIMVGMGFSIAGAL